MRMRSGMVLVFRGSAPLGSTTVVPVSPFAASHSAAAATKASWEPNAQSASVLAWLLDELTSIASSASRSVITLPSGAGARLSAFAIASW